jgi:hypothetical protein
MSNLNDDALISFIAPSTLIDPAFWEELYERKLNIYKLGTDKEPLSVYYNCSDSKNVEPFVLEGSSFRTINDEEGEKTILRGRISALGTLVNVNTLEVRKISDSIHVTWIHRYEWTSIS